jgi:hypothetical protein
LANSSAPTAVAAAEEKKDKPVVKPEMILVTYKGKIIQMPRDEYEKLQDKDDEELLMANVPEEGPEEESNEEETEEEQQEQPEEKKTFGWKKRV